MPLYSWMRKIGTKGDNKGGNSGWPRLGDNRTMIFVLGGAGFVGSAFVRVAAAAGRECVVIRRDNYREYTGRRCDLLVNANGNSRKPLARQAPLEEFDASV